MTEPSEILATERVTVRRRRAAICRPDSRRVEKSDRETSLNICE